MFKSKWKNKLGVGQCRWENSRQRNRMCTSGGGTSSGASGRGRPACQKDSWADLETRTPAPASTSYAASLCQGQLKRVNQMRFDRNRGQSDVVLRRRGQSDVVRPQGAQNHIQVAGLRNCKCSEDTSQAPGGTKEAS